MHDPASTPQPNVSQIVANALRTAADGLSRWLEVPVDADEILTSWFDVETAEQSLAAPDEVLCCCTMPVELSVRQWTPASLSSAVSAANPQDLQETACDDLPAGRLLMAWKADEAARLIDQSLRRDDTSSDPSTWSSLNRSVIAETSNVVGCEFLNAVAQEVSSVSATDVSLIPSPPDVRQQFAGSVMDATMMEIESREASGAGQQFWLAVGRFTVAGYSIETKFAMVWTPSVWLRLSRLVESSPVTDEEQQS